MTNINTNIGALTALKNLEATDAAMSKAMARLSSGLKINNAADDAAGSALATKMEATVRSLDVAIRNSEDAISMTQTAEGALGQMENILQRVRELAVQAGNSTLSSNDRDMIQNEVTQLVAKIDSIAASTDFNGIQLLDGSRATVSFQIGTQAADELKVDLNKADSKTLGLGGSEGVKMITTNRVAKTDYSGASALAAADIKLNGENLLSEALDDDLSGASNKDAAGEMATAINLNTGVHGAVADAFNTVTSKAKGEFKMDGVFVVNDATIKLSSSYTELVDNINTLTTGVTAQLNDDNTITISNTDGDDIVLTAGAAGTGLTDVGFTAATYSGFVGITNLDGSAVTIEAGNVANGYGSTTSIATGTHADIETFGFMEVKDNSVMESGIVTSTALTSAMDVKINDVKVGPTTTNSATSKALAINAITGETGVTATARTELTIVASFTSSLFPPTSTDIELNGDAVNLSAANDLDDIVKAFNDEGVGDIRAEATSDGKIRLSSESGVNIKLKDAGSGTATNMMFSTATDIHGEEITHSSGTFTAYGNITLTSADGSPIKISGTTAHIAHLGLIQQSEELKITGSGISVDSLTNAQNSLSKIDDAIEKVSLYRSSFGAIENRIDASMNNLTTLKVNTEASLSRIIDANFAEETSNLTKNQILNQAATSMLAQANASKQNLLALLQG